MALSVTERAILDEIKRDTKEARDASIRTETIVAEHTKQISKLFSASDAHADKLITIETTQVLCKEDQAKKGNLAERKGNKLTAFGNIIMIVAIVVSLLIGIAGLLKS